MGLSDLFAAILALFRRAPVKSGEVENFSTTPAPTIDAAHVATAAPAPVVAPVVPVPVTPSATAAKPEVAPVSAAPALVTDFSTPAAFIAAVAPAAQACARRTGVPASVTVAQAALESSWGKRVPGMNLFGIKADASWSGPVTSQVTHEVVNGKTIEITALFRAYSDWRGSIDDHAAFLTGNPRYKAAFAFKDGPGFARAIAEAGYATDPLYADKLIAIMSTRGLGALDHPEPQA